MSSLALTGSKLNLLITVNFLLLGFRLQFWHGSFHCKINGLRLRLCQQEAFYSLLVSIIDHLLLV